MFVGVAHLSDPCDSGCQTPSFSIPFMKIETHLDYQTILANRAQPVHFAIRFEADSKTHPRPKPAAFCVVLDRSGSMAGKPLDKAKEAARLAVKNLRPEDLFSLVVFDEEAQTVIPLQPAANKNETFVRAISTINDGGSTNLSGGWMLGRDELKKAPKDTTRRLLVLSDGHLNAGIVELPVVRQLVTSGLEKDLIRTSCLGFSEGYNEDLMSELARVTGGQFYDADAPEKIPAIFASELDGLQKLSIQNLRVRLARLDFCDAAELLGNSPVVQLPDGRTEIAVGDLVSGETRVLCFALGVLPLPFISGKPAFSLEGEKLVEIEILFDEIGESEIHSRSITQLIRIQATQNPDEVKVREEVIGWVAMQKTGRVLDEVTKHMDSGKNNEAIALLSKTIEQLKAYGPKEQVNESIAQLEQLMGKIDQGQWTVRERKASAYRSSQMRRMSSADIWTLDDAAPSFKKPSKPNAIDTKTPKSGHA